MLISWLLFIHILSAITFFLAHGASAAMAFKLRTETDFTRISALLDLSGSTIMLIFIAYLLVLLTGVTMAFLAHLWDQIWIWLSLLLMVFVFSYMTFFNGKNYAVLRRLIGLPYMVKNKPFLAEPPASADVVAEFMKKVKIASLVIVGYVIPAFVLWLMIFKPF